MNPSERFARLIQAIDPSARLLRFWPLTGGVSARTTALEFERPGGVRDRVVVREYGDADVARDPLIAEHEYRLLRAVRHAGLPVPTPIYFDQSGEIFGSPALVIEFVDGEVIVDPPRPARHIAEFAAWLARIHAIDLTTTDLGFLAPVELDVEARLRSFPDDTDIEHRILNALDGKWPPRSRNEPVLLHGDYWQSNLLWRDDELAAIIDWEDAAIGEPLTDVARTRLELHWSLGELARERFTSHFNSYRDLDLEGLPAWDLAMALGPSRALATWGLPAEREGQMRSALARFVEQAEQQLAIGRS